MIQQILRMASENDIDLHVIARRDVPNGRLTEPDEGSAPERSAKAASAAAFAATCMQRFRWASALAATWVPSEVLGHGQRVGRAVRLAQGEDGLIDDVLVRAIADAAVDGPRHAGLLADLGHPGRFHVDGAEPALQNRSPDVVVVEQSVGRHEATGGLPRWNRVGSVFRAVGIELHPARDEERADRERGVEPTGDPDDHHVIEPGRRQRRTGGITRQGRSHADGE